LPPLRRPRPFWDAAWFAAPRSFFSCFSLVIEFLVFR
jgi:hypothetical protein